MVVIVIISVLFIFYAILIGFYDRSWKQIPAFHNGFDQSNEVRFSVIIPARNEEQNIGRLLQSLLRQSYPREFFEVIVIDDHSNDGTVEIVQQYLQAFGSLQAGESIKVLRLTSGETNSYKKKAIETGIAAAQNEWIVCTDADCEVPESWLKTFADFITEDEPVFIAAPVKLTKPGAAPNGRLLYIFQFLDFMTLQGITGASVYKRVHSMCNGANLAYQRNVFYEAGGFKGVDEIASGDDMLLMHKIWKRYPDKVAYLKSKDAIVKTAAAPTWKDFFNQRIRWASKAKYYDDKRIFWVLVLVYLFNFSFLVLSIAMFFNIKYLYTLLILWVAKTIIEWSFMENVSRFFNRQNLMKHFFLFQPLHIGYTIISGFLGSFGKYEWKGRRVK